MGLQALTARGLHACALLAAETGVELDRGPNLSQSNVVREGPAVLPQVCMSVYYLSGSLSALNTGLLQVMLFSLFAHIPTKSECTIIHTYCEPVHSWWWWSDGSNPGRPHRGLEFDLHVRPTLFP